MGHIAPDAAEVDPDVLARRPQKGLIVARLKLSEGRIRTHRLLKVGGEARPIRFKTLRGDVPKVEYSQALADWVVAEIPISGCQVRLVDTSLEDGIEPRFMTLAPAECNHGNPIEMAILNVPQSSFQPSAAGTTAAHERIGHHFEMYYELAARRPPNRLRPVPYEALRPGVAWLPLHPKSDEISDFLASIVLPNSKGLASPPLCPVIRFSD